MQLLIITYISSPLLFAHYLFYSFSYGYLLLYVPSYYSYILYLLPYYSFSILYATFNASPSISFPFYPFLLFLCSSVLNSFLSPTLFISYQVPPTSILSHNPLYFLPIPPLSPLLYIFTHDGDVIIDRY